MQNFVQEGNTITVTSPGIIKSGDGVLVKSTFGIAAFDANLGDPLELVLEGVFVLPKAAVGLIPLGACDAQADSNNDPGVGNNRQG